MFMQNENTEALSRLEMWYNTLKNKPDGKH